MDEYSPWMKKEYHSLDMTLQKILLETFLLHILDSTFLFFFLKVILEREFLDSMSSFGFFRNNVLDILS